MVNFCVAFIIGAAGFSLFKFFRLPNPALLGSLVVTGALSAAGYFPRFTAWPVSFAANTAIGVMIGHQIDRTVISRMRSLMRPVLVQTIGILALSLICGFTMYAMNSSGTVSLGTSLISGAAGGITEMMVFGMSVDADVAVIAFVQLFRIIVFVAIMPYLSIIGRKLGGGTKRAETAVSGGSVLPEFSARNYASLLIFALIGAAAGLWSRIPAGTMLGAMAACGILSLAVNKRYSYDTRIRSLSQIGLGLVMGQRISPNILERLGATLIPVVVATFVMLVGCALLAFLLFKTTGWDLATCLLCASPAGISQVSIFAEEIGADSLTTSVFHTVRVVGIVSFYPWIIMSFLR
jgi:membrane AbrB-like protein